MSAAEPPVFDDDGLGLDCWVQVTDSDHWVQMIGLPIKRLLTISFEYVKYMNKRRHYT